MSTRFQGMFKGEKMTSPEKTDWTSLLSSKCAVNTLNSFATGAESTRAVTSKFANTPKAGEFRKLVRNYGTTYARSLTRKALRYRGLMK
jgi:hypothetical protein